MSIHGQLVVEKLSDIIQLWELLRQPAQFVVRLTLSSSELII